MKWISHVDFSFPLSLHVLGRVPCTFLISHTFPSCLQYLYDDVAVLLEGGQHTHDETLVEG
jgi:hypothetical protein